MLASFSKALVYIVDGLESKTPPSVDEVILGDRRNVITAVRWKDSTTYGSLKPEETDLIWASAQTAPEGNSEVKVWLNTKPLRRLNFEGFNSK